MDAEGWSYAVDFNWFTYPPPPGSGKMTYKSFVRRRRWVRTRERLEGAPGAAASEVSRSSLSASSRRGTQDGLTVAPSGPSASDGSFSSKALAVAAAVAASVSGRSSPAAGSPQLSPRALGTTSTPGSAAAAEAASPPALTHKASLLSLLDHVSIASDSASSLNARSSPLPPLQPGGPSPVPGATPEQQRTQQAAAQGLLQQISASSEEEELPAAAAGPTAAAGPAAATAATSTPPAAFPTAALRSASGSLQAEALGSPAEASSPMAAVQDNDDDPLEPMEEATPKPPQLKPALQRGGGGSGSNRASPTAAAARAPRTRSPTHPGSGSSSPTSSAATPIAAWATAAAASPPPAQPAAPAATTPPAPTAAKAPTSPVAEAKAPITRSPVASSDPRPVAAVAKSLLSPVATAAAPSSSPTAPRSGAPSTDGSPSSGRQDFLSDFVNSKSSSFFSSMTSMVQNINTSMQSQINEVAEVLGSLDSVKSGRSPIASGSGSGSRASSGGLAGALRGDLARSSFGRSLTGGLRDKGDKDA
jgi:hypothetical protein